MKEVALSRWRSRDCRDAVPTEASANFPGIPEAGMDDLSELCCRPCVGQWLAVDMILGEEFSSAKAVF